MFCSRCGANVPDNTSFCTRCGNAMTNKPTQTPYQSNLNPSFGGASGMSHQTPPMSMKWYKFLIWFVLFASVFLSAVQGIMMLTGLQYGSAEDAELVYAYVSGLKLVDLLVGVLYLAVAALALYTRMQLAGYKADGPKLLGYCYMAGIVINVVYFLGWFFIFGDVSDIVASVVGGTISSAAMIFINKTYFEKRAHLFVN